jgi:FMN-dependent oxidoreductase (nitrilotriacetate monooxygenase family)
MSRYAHLNLFTAGHGYHEAAWRFSPSGGGPVDLEHFARIAATAERGVIDSIFFADTPGVAEFRTKHMPQVGFDPIDLLAAMTPLTSHIGLLATASTTYSTPWDLARRFATLDHLSHGRAGWNIVTTHNPVASHNFGQDDHLEHGARYGRAREFVEVVLKIWDGWSEDAVIASQASGEWADPTRLHPPAHEGEHFSVAGILPFPRSPQGYPVLAQAGSSTEGVDLASRFADVVFTPQGSMEAGIAFRQRIRAAAASHGRDLDQVRTLPGLSFVLGSTQAEADAAWAQLEAASSEEFRLRNLLQIAGIAQSSFPEVDPDGKFPFSIFERGAGQTFAAAVTRLAREEHLTFRQAAHRFATLPGGLHFTGSPEGLADLIETWWRAGAADGFTIQPLRLPVDLDLFVDAVVPLLQARGVTRSEYSPGTLREQLGLPLIKGSSARRP